MADAGFADPAAHGGGRPGEGRPGARIGDAGAGAGHPAPARGHVPLAVLWFGLFGAPAAWTLQTLVNFPLAAHSCFPSLYPLAEPTVGGLRGIVLAVSIAAVGVCVAALAVAWREWRRTRGEAQESAGAGREQGAARALLETGAGRTRFMAMGGMLMSGAFLIASIAHLATVFFMAPCGAV